MVEVKKSSDVTQDELVAFFQLIATLNAQEKAIIYDLPDHLVSPPSLKTVKITFLRKNYSIKLIKRYMSQKTAEEIKWSVRNLLSSSLHFFTPKPF